MVLLLEAPRAVHSRAFLNHVALGARDQAQDLRRLAPDILRPEVARCVVRHGADGPGEARVEPPFGAELGEVFEEVARVAATSFASSEPSSHGYSCLSM